MTKKEMINRIATLGYTKRDAAQVYDDVMKAIRDSLMEGESVTLPSIGNFEIKSRAPRMSRNLITGEMMEIPGHNYIKFNVSKALKNEIKMAGAEQE